MSSEHLHHPIQAAIDDIWNAGHTPRLQIDARRDDVVVPDSVRSKWGARLVLDLDASWPLNLEMDESGVAVDLAFQGVVTRCTLPWASIYVVLDRSTGRGIVIESHLPTDGAGEAPQPAPRRAALRSVPAAERDALPSVPASEAEERAPREQPTAPSQERTPARAERAVRAASPMKPAPGKPSDAEPTIVPSAISSASDEPASGARSGGDASSEEEARRRRSRFKVIDGGQ